MRVGGGIALLGLKEEELRLGPGHQRVPFGRRHGNDFLQADAWIAGEGLTIRRVDVADHPGDAFARCAGPGEDAERREVGPQVHVRLFDTDETLDRRSVEHDLAIERFHELAVRDLDVLDRAEDVGELQAHELDLLALGPLENLRLCFARGRCFGHDFASILANFSRMTLV